MQENLYTPSLADGEAKKTKSYDIGYLFYVAFLGGIIAVSILGIRNAKWLQLEKKNIRLLIMISTILFIIKLTIVYAVTHQLIDVESSMSKVVSRVAGVICFFFYYAFLRGAFKEHLALNGDTEPLMFKAILVIVLAAVIEAVLILGISSI